MNDRFELTVLIVGQATESQEQIRRWLASETDLEVVGVVNSGLAALQVASDMYPSIVLLNTNLPDSLEIATAITKQVPQSQVVVIGSDTISENLKRFMLAGARDFLSEPVTHVELLASVRSVYHVLPRGPKRKGNL